jgi:hypothetical protein
MGVIRYRSVILDQLIPGTWLSFMACNAKAVHLGDLLLQVGTVMTFNRFLFKLPSLFLTGAIAALAVHGPIAQLENYHAFADQSLLLGIPHAADVLSNLVFLLVAAWGLYRLWPQRAHPALRDSWPGTLLFLCALLLTAFGSTYYHLAPDNARLVWDRLPIALVCVGLLAAVRAELICGAYRWRDVLVLGVLAIVSVMWWTITDWQGKGDLRPYLLLQVLPLVLIPLWQHIYRANTQHRWAFGLALLLYAVAKLAELADHQVLDMLHLLSGHTVKHLCAGAAAAVITARLVDRCRS